MHSRESVHVAMTGVFDPVSRGEQTPASDIDTAGLSSPGRSASSPSWSWKTTFSPNQLGAQVDMVTPDAIKPVMRERIARETTYV